MTNEIIGKEVQSIAPALDRAIDIIEFLGKTGEPATLSQISRTLDLPKNSVFRITQTLLSRGYLIRNKEMEFSLSSKFIRIASQQGARMSLPELANSEMEKLRNLTKETIQLGVLNGREGVIIHQIEGLQPLRIVVDIGLRFLLYCNAPGKMLLAHMPLQQRKEAIESMKLERLTGTTITDKQKLHQECERIIDKGYSTDFAEADEGIHCIAGPIFNPDLTLAGTLWITGPAKRLPRNQFSKFGEMVKEAGQQISFSKKNYS